MRRPNVKWLFKTACFLIIAGTLFILITGYLSASPYTNRPNVVPYEHLSQAGQPRKHKDHVVEEEPRRGGPLVRPVPLAPSLEQADTKDEAEEFNNAIDEEDPNQVEEENEQRREQDQKQQQQILPPNQAKKDWHDYTAMERDAKRVGFGEQGKRAANNDESTREIERKMSLENGFNAYLSDMISVNRSVPDIRYKGYVINK